MRWFALLLLVPLLLIAPVRSEPSLCDWFDKYATGANVEFNDAAYRWDNKPADMEPLAFLPINDPTWLSVNEQEAYYLEFSPSTGQVWVYRYWSMEANADANGDHMGNHRFCVPVKVIETKRYAG